MSNVIDINKLLEGVKDLPRALKILKSLPKEDANEIISFITSVIVAETRYWLGLHDEGPEEPIFYQHIHAAYQESYKNCCFCDPDLSVGKDSEICIVCHKKIIDLMELRSKEWTPKKIRLEKGGDITDDQI